MSRPPLSEKQAAAVLRPPTDACVTAGAGSGKTRVLAERFVHMVRENGFGVRDLAALTFTEKAAEEMRGRIAEYFEDAGEEAARAEVEFASISTIHAFCAKLLRLHAVEAGVDPSFQVLDAGESALLIDDAAALAENELEERNPDALLGYHALPRYKQRDECIKLLGLLRGSGIEPERIEWRPADIDVETAKAATLSAIEEFAACENEVHREHVARFRDVLDRCRSLETLDIDEGVDVAAFATWQLHDVVGDLTKMFKPGGGFTKARNALKDALEVLGGVHLDVWGRASVLPALREMLATIDRTYAELKRERSALDFTDLELETVRLLDRLAQDGRALDLAPGALLVDEYQDTNPLQARILERLRATASQFSVGDPKQSIYRFRRADVGVILDERERVGDEGCHGLDASYRAHPMLVQGVNALNEALFRDGAAGVPYEPLVAMGTFRDTDEVPLEVTFIDIGKGGSAEQARMAEAEWIAQHIEEFVARGVPRTKADVERPFGYGDIAVLFRARTQIDIYEAALSRRGIPYVTMQGAGYLDTDEIGDLLHVLRVVHDPSDEHALACVATGPALGAEDDDLLRWFGHEGERAWDRMLADASRGGRYAANITALDRLRADAVAGSLANTVEGALRSLGLLEVALVERGGERRAANLRKSVGIARRLDASGRRGLGDLLRHLFALREREMAEPEAAIGARDADVVRLTTVHGAKGLEFPLVILADAGRAIGSNRRPPLLHDGDGRIAARMQDPVEGAGRRSGGYQLLEQEESRLDDREQQRVLYVATTRAEERLVISAWCKGATGKPPRPSSAVGWAKQIWRLLQSDFAPGERLARLGEATVRLRIVPAATVEPGAGQVEPRSDLLPTDEDRAWAATKLAEAEVETCPLGDTRYVVSVSELLAFAADPSRYYAENVLLEEHVYEDALPDLDAMGEAGAETRGHERVERLDRWDEPGETVDRAALGRVVHAVLEHVPGATVDDVLRGALREEYPAGTPDGVEAQARGMIRRYLDADVGRAVAASLDRKGRVRREVAFHTRIRFPGDVRVATFDSLLVKGTLDLWHVREDGVWVVDYKTNRKSKRFPTPESLADYYAWQLRLYALAAERLLGEDVAGASLLLLDDSWGDDVLEVPIDVSGTRLEETRRLCEAFARAELEGRYPSDWRDLLH